MSKSINVRRTVDDFKKIISNFVKEGDLKKEATFDANFAKKRALKKLEIPDNRRRSERYQQCWDSWQSYDYSLQNLKLNEDVIKRIRLNAYSYFGSRHIKLTSSNVSITNGSTVIPTKGRGSYEDKVEILEWTCTASCYEHFAKSCYDHRALKSSAKKRIKAYCLSRKIPYRGLCRELYTRFSNTPKRKIGYEIFKFLLRAIVTIVPGSRFSTVPKNNEKDRPINMEPFGNLVVQRQIGLFIKNAIFEQFGLDLDTLADVHKRRLSLDIATIDLSNASDSITCELVKRIFPTHVYDLLMSSRSEYVYEPRSGDYHKPTKISSMGNGFTFELMTYILLCLTRSYDPGSSVFGDDIIVSDDAAVALLDSLKGIGFVPNADKTAYGTNPFRESCGANWHSSTGYIYSVDLHFPKDIVDCIVFYNKVLQLYRRYGIFRNLERSLRRAVPDALRGRDDKTSLGPLCEITYDDYFHIDKRSGRGVLPKWAIAYLETIQYDHRDFYMIKSFKKTSKRSNKTTRDLRSDQIGKYFSYLRAGRVCDNLLVDITQTASVTFISNGSCSFRCSAIPS